MTILNNDQIQMLQNWRSVQDKINSFMNKVNPRMLSEILPEKDAYRLIQYVPGNSFETFKTYLTADEYNQILKYIMTNPYL